MADPLWITEADVVALLDLPAAIDALTRGLATLATNRAATMPETHLPTPDGATLHAVGGWLAQAAGGAAIAGAKTWTDTGSGSTPLLVLWSAGSGALIAVIESNALAQLRTAATCGVATVALAPPYASIGALAGTGRQALAQAAAMCNACPLTELRVFSPDTDHRRGFVARARAAGLEIAIVEVDSMSEAVDGAQVITLATRSSEPILHAPMVTAHAHVNATGATTTERAEVAPDLVAACALVVADDPETARRLAPRELAAVDDVVSLADILEAITSVPSLQGAARPVDADLTLFKPTGLGVSDVVLGAEVLALAGAAGRGRSMPAPEQLAPSLVRRYAR